MVYFDGVSLIEFQGDEPTPQELLDEVDPVSWTEPGWN